MEANIDQFLQLVNEIECNSWWKSQTGISGIRPGSFTFSVDDGGTPSITEVPSEPLESLLIRVRRLTLNDEPENLGNVQKKAKMAAANDVQRNLYDTWRKYWQLAFIKEPYLLENGDRSDVMTPFKAYNIFVNGCLFHSDPDHQEILFGSDQCASTGFVYLFLKNQYHWTVANLCLAAIGLRTLIKSSGPLVVSGQPPGVMDFVWWRNRLPQLTEQCKIFSDWIEEHGKCKHGRWP
ncbi:MAG TPA: hypothetical protein VHU84_07515 [Lacipirellulaceae bacterium]|nr:hypothetical protein [Lacipirellulaceae bacterium]